MISGFYGLTMLVYIEFFQILVLLFQPSPEWGPAYLKDPSKGLPSDLENHQLGKAQTQLPSQEPVQKNYKGGLPPPPSFLVQDTSYAPPSNSFKPTTYDNPAFDQSGNQL